MPKVEIKMSDHKDDVQRCKKGVIIMAKMDIVSVEVGEDNSAEALAYLQKKIEKGLKEIGMEAEGYAIKDCPMDTGRLRNSIAWAINGEHSTGGGRDAPKSEPDQNELFIGTNVEYGVYVEYGDKYHKVGKKHFLRDAAMKHSDHYKSIMDAAINS